MVEPTERTELLDVGRALTVEGFGEARIVERRGTADRPILRLDGMEPRDIRGADLLASREDVGALADGEWLVDDLVGLEVDGVGAVTGVRLGPSVDVLEVETDAGELLIPLNRDAIRSVDMESRRIEVDRHFLGIEPDEKDTG